MFTNYAATIFDTKITTNVPMAVTISADGTTATVTPAPGCYVKGSIQITNTGVFTILTPKFACVVRKHEGVYELKFY